MRQTSKRARRSRVLMILIFMLLTALVLWGLAALLSRLFHDGANATVSAKDYEQLTPVEPRRGDQTEEIPQNTYDPSCFYMDGGFLHYESDTVTSQIGIDVSGHRAGDRLAARCGKRHTVCYSPCRLPRVYGGHYSGGCVFPSKNLESAPSTPGLTWVCISSRRPSMSRRREKKHGLRWTGSPAISSAFPVFFDMGEDRCRSACSDTMDLASLTTVTDTFCTEIRNAGYQAGLYFNQQLGYEELHLPSLQTYTFWLAEYNDTLVVCLPL